MDNQSNVFSTLNLKSTFPFKITKYKGFERSKHLISMEKDVQQFDEMGISEFPDHLFDSVDTSSPLESDGKVLSSSFSISLDKDSLKKPMPVYGHIMTADQPQNVSMFCSKLTPSLSDSHISKSLLVDKWNDDQLKMNYNESSTSDNCIVNSEGFYPAHSNYYDCCNIECNTLSRKYSTESLETQNYETISQDPKSAFPLEYPTHYSRNISQNSTTNLLTIASQKLYELVSASNENHRPESISASSDAQSYHSFGNESLFHHDIAGKQQALIQKGTSLVFSTDKATAIRSVTTPVVFLCRPQESRILLRMTVSLIKTYQIINEMYYSKKRRRTTEHISSDDSFHRDTKRFLNTCNCSNNEVVQCHNDVDWCSKKRYHHHHHRHTHYHHHLPKNNDHTQEAIDMPPKRRHHKHMHSHHHHHKHSTDSKIDKKHMSHDPCCIPKCSHCNTNSSSAKEYLVKPGEVWMNRYSMDLLIGTGSFGQVVRANDLTTGEPVAIKIIRNRRSFVQQAETEIRLLRMLARYQEDQDIVTVPHWGANCIVRLKSHFMYRGHLCLVFELLTYSLYELLKNTGFSGVSLNLTKKFGLQLCSALHFLSQPSLQIIHCDLKPENVLLVHPRRSAIKVVDFGSSCRLNERLYVYIQSRFYRAPEVLLYLPYNMAIDMWSLGCILVELHTGQPLFVGQYEHEQMLRIIEVVGMPPDHMIRCSKRANKYFIESEMQLSESGVASNVFHEPKVFRNRDGKRIPFEGVGARKLSSIIGTETGGPDGRRKDEPGHSPQDYACFLDLINRMLTIDPFKRITPEEALKHPFFCCAGRHSTLSSTADLTSIRNSPS